MPEENDSALRGKQQDLLKTNITIVEGRGEKENSEVKSSFYPDQIETRYLT